MPDDTANIDPETLCINRSYTHISVSFYIVHHCSPQLYMVNHLFSCIKLFATQVNFDRPMHLDVAKSINNPAQYNGHCIYKVADPGGGGLGG